MRRATSPPKSAADSTVLLLLPMQGAPVCELHKSVLLVAYCGFWNGARSGEWIVTGGKAGSKAFLIR